MNVEIMSAEQAKEFPQLILPAVTEHDSFDDFTFYAGMEKDTLCGMVVADPRVSAPEILSVGVGKKHTGKGIGEELLSYAISDIIHDFQEANLDGPNRIGAMLPDGLVDDTAVCNLLKKCGFTKEDEDIYYEATVSMIKDNPYLDSPTVRKKAEHKGFVSLQKADKKAVDVFYNNLLTKENYEVPDKEKLDKDVSYFDIRNGVVHGCVLYEMISEDTLQNVFVYQNEQDALDNSFVYLCAASAQKIAKKYPK
nr:GNAT family N-acetyltransferase [Lachnospiraceae bacterium]